VGFCKTVQDSVGYVSQCRTVWVMYDSAGLCGLCKTAQDSAGRRLVMLDSAGQCGLCKTVQNSVGYLKQCRTVQAWLGIKNVKC
jgi:hypothetical protein